MSELRKPRISVIGLGKLGAPRAAVFACKGFETIGLDINSRFVEAINDGRAPVEEPRLPSTVAGCRSYLAGRVVTEAATLAPALGFFNFIGWLKRLKVAPYVIFKACLNRKTKKRS